MISRRSILTGLLSTLAAPAIIRTPGLLMPVKPAPRMLTLAEYAMRMGPSWDKMIEEISKANADLIIYGTGMVETNLTGLAPFFHRVPPTEWSRLL